MAKDHQKTQHGQEIPNLTEEEARAYFESRRWPTGPVCPHCGSKEAHLLQGSATRPGLYHCRECREQYSVTVGTVMEDTHLPLATWARAFHLMCSSKKGVSALQMQRTLGIGSYRTAWHLAHRIREAMRSDPATEAKLSGTVEADEAFVGGKYRHVPGVVRKQGPQGDNKTPVMVLVERNGKARSKPLPKVTAETLRKEIRDNVEQTATLMTDECHGYTAVGKEMLGGHHSVCHSKKEYARREGNLNVHNNTAESYFAILKRGVYGTFHHLSKQHLHRYCHEFSFRWNGRNLMDTERRDAAVVGIEGKRLMYKRTVS